MLTPTEIGIVFALLTALFKGIQSLFQKHSALATNEYVTGFSSRLFGLLILIPANLWVGLPKLEQPYYLALVPMALLIAFTSILIARAYKLSDVSLVSPMFATGPVLVLLTSFLILGEQTRPIGILGVCLTATGAYFLKRDTEQDLLAPFRRLATDRGVQLIMVVVVIYSITANIDKIALQSSSPLFWALSVYASSSVAMFPIMVRETEDWYQTMRTSWRPLCILGLLGGAYASFQMLAFERANVAHVIGIKRLSILVAVVGGWLVFDETNIRQRLFGASIMITGTILIYLSTGP